MNNNPDNWDDLPSPPEWFEDALKKTPRPTAKDVAPYAFMKDDFLAAISLARKAILQEQKAETASALDAVFNLAGELVRPLGEFVEELLIMGQRQPAQVSTRSIQPQRVQTPSGTQSAHPDVKIINRYPKAHGKYSVFATTYLEGQQTILEIDVIDCEKKTDVRPFRVHVCNEDGEELAPWMDVGSTGTAKFPGPSEDVYIFEVRWEDETAFLKIQFK